MTLTEEIRRCLRMPTFDNWQWEDEEILLLLQQMYVDLDLARKFDIDLDVLRKFLCQVYMNYNEVPFHNFQHCFTVSQMVGLLEVVLLYNTRPRRRKIASGNRSADKKRCCCSPCCCHIQTIVSLAVTRGRRKSSSKSGHQLRELCYFHTQKGGNMRSRSSNLFHVFSGFPPKKKQKIPPLSCFFFQSRKQSSIYN